MSSKSRKKASKKGSAGPIAFFVALFIVALGIIQLASTFHVYALNMAELNGLKKQEASLIAQKQELENDIARWDDKAYVTAQARDRLGFVFPGEQAIRVEHPEAVTGETTEDKKTTDESQKTVLLGTRRWRIRSNKPTSRMKRSRWKRPEVRQPANRMRMEQARNLVTSSKLHKTITNSNQEISRSDTGYDNQRTGQNLGEEGSRPACYRA